MYLLEIDKNHKELLASIRHWENVKIAFSETTIWLKDFTLEQINASDLQQIPHLIFYEVKENLLFLRGSVLPSKKAPSALLWSPIKRALPVELPSLNHNFFGIQEKVAVQIIKSEIEREAFALLTSIATAKEYIENAPEIRLKPLHWTVLEDKILFIGTPLLPIKGTTFWKNTEAFLPTGFDFELPILSDVIANRINANRENLALWESDSSCVLIPKNSVKPLSISSFRNTFN